MENTPALNNNDEKKGRKRNYKWFIGIDVSKDELDFAVMRDSGLLFHAEIENNKKCITGFCRSLKQRIPGFRMANALFCMESTGFYGLILTKALISMKADFVVENALRIKRSSGIIRGKDDRSDAILIAKYACNHSTEIRLWKPKRIVLEELKQLLALRSRLLEVSTKLRKPIKEQGIFFPKTFNRKIHALCQKTIQATAGDLEAIEITIDMLIAGDSKLKRLMQIVTSVKSIGKITALYIILSTNEFENINCPRKFACYAGVAPFKNESGKAVNRLRTSAIANRKMKSLLHLCAMGAIYRQPDIKAYYERKTQKEGKPGMLVINAIRNKLILRVFACVKEDRLFVTDHVRSQSGIN